MKNNTTKEQVLNFLKNNNNSYVSGQEIANRLFLTRAAVWKSIKSLRQDGLNIEAVNNKGYCLISEYESLSESAIRSHTKGSYDFEIDVFDEVDSTNNVAFNIAHSGTSSNRIIVTDSQTNGRGRRGRSFFSPKGSGLYMSFLLKPDMPISQATLLTCMSAVAICRAIDEVCKINTSIKWVNDIYIGDKKVSGILTEGFTSLEDGKLTYMIIGIGINITVPKDGFPSEIKKTATALYKKAAPENVKNKLCAAIIDNFLRLYSSGDTSFVNEYKNRSNLIGRYVKVNPTEGDQSLGGYALVKGIDDECHLLVEYENGKTESLSTGEVSVVKY